MIMESPFVGFIPVSVDHALVDILEALFHSADGKFSGSRRNDSAGDIAEFVKPAVVRWDPTTPIVSMWPTRDANPFFHLFESLHMLGGRNDLESLLYFNSKFGNYSDDGKEIRGSAYGKRWRNFFRDEAGQTIDQLYRAVSELQKNPVGRRVVIEMWSSQDLNIVSKDVPCNTHIYFLSRDGESLEMTVCNRSNDALYGLTGANVVHFSMLHAYVVAMLNSRGVRMTKGFYYQFSNNLHAYTSNPVIQKIRAELERSDSHMTIVHPSGQLPKPEETQEDLDYDINKILSCTGRLGENDSMRSEFGLKTLKPMMRAWTTWKEEKDPEKAASLLMSEASPWCVSGEAWMNRRAARKRAGRKTADA